MVSIPLPEELRGKPFKIVLEDETTKTKPPTQDKNKETEQNTKKGVLGLRGILKGRTTEELEEARYEYLVEKYVHD